MIVHSNQGKVDDQVGQAIGIDFPQIPLLLFQSEIPVFTMHDFRLFDHFIQVAYPHHPVGNDSVWTHEIPSLASDVRIPNLLGHTEL